MSEGPKEQNQLYDDINITPMLDLAYVLLVTFIILTTAAVQGVRVQSPLTVAANNLGKPQTRAITVTADGSVFLDAYPVKAHTGAGDALWAGLPAPTCPGKTFASRGAASLLTSLGLPELIAENLEDSERRAVHLAQHPDDLGQLRTRLAANRAT